MNKDFVEIWDVLKRIQQEKGEEIFGDLPIIGMENKLVQYAKGGYNQVIHQFYETYGHYFVNCIYDNDLRYSRRRFNKEINDGNIRILRN